MAAPREKRGGALRLSPDIRKGMSRSAYPGNNRGPSGDVHRPYGRMRRDEKGWGQVMVWCPLPGKRVETVIGHSIFKGLLQRVLPEITIGGSSTGKLEEFQNQNRGLFFKVRRDRGMTGG